jgi:hypothetical protein
VCDYDGGNDQREAYADVGIDWLAGPGPELDGRSRASRRRRWLALLAFVERLAFVGFLALVALLGHDRDRIVAA